MSKKIVYCIPSLHLVGGMEKVATIKANYFTEVYGHDVTFVLTDQKSYKPFFALSPKINVINLDINFEDIRTNPLPIKIVKYYIKQYIFKKRLKQVLFRIRPDITISMLRREINFITSIKDGSIKIGELQFNRDNYRDFNTTENSFFLKRWAARFWMNQLINNLQKLDKFVVLSKEDFDNWPEIKHKTYIHNPIEKLPERVSNCESKKVIAAGRFVSQKGFDMLIQAWALVTSKHPDWELSIYGNGDKSSYKKQILDLNLKNCHLFDAVKNINEKYLESSIFAFSSRFEGFGMVLAEAMSCGIPPVAFSCPCGPKDIIDNNINGILVEPNNVEELANKICFLIENTSIRKQLGAEARLKSQQFLLERMADKWNAIFHDTNSI